MGQRHHKDCMCILCEKGRKEPKVSESPSVPGYVELRWVVYGNIGQQILQYRSIQPTADASGALCPGEWGEWADVPFIDGLKKCT